MGEGQEISPRISGVYADFLTWEEGASMPMNGILSKYLKKYGAESGNVQKEGVVKKRCTSALLIRSKVKREAE